MGGHPITAVMARIGLKSDGSRAANGRIKVHESQRFQLPALVELRIRILKVMGWVLGALVLSGLAFRMAMAPLKPLVIVLAIVLALSLFALPLFGSAQRWTPRLGRAITMTFMLLIAGTGYLAGGLDAPVLVLLSTSPLLGMVIVNRRFGIVAAVLVVLVLCGLLALHRAGWMPATELSAEAMLIMRAFMIMMAMTVVVAVVFIYDQYSHELMRRFQHESLTDALTDLPNRRHFEQAFVQLERKAAESRSELWIALIDVDHFKAINDRSGHEGGDRCLRMIAAILRQSMMPLDDAIVARLSGDEFVVAAIAGGAHLRALMHRVNARLADLDEGVRMAVSVGMSGARIAEAPRPEVMRRLLARADAALYEAKRGGRGRVNMLDGQMSLDHSPAARRRANRLPVGSCEVRHGAASGP